MKIVLEPGESREEMLTALSSVVRDNVNKAIVRYVLDNEEHAYLNEISRALTDKGIGSRKTVYDRLVDLETTGVLDTAMVKIPYQNSKEHSTKVWVKRYSLSDRHKAWAKRLLD